MPYITPTPLTDRHLAARQARLDVRRTAPQMTAAETAYLDYLLRRLAIGEAIGDDDMAAVAALLRQNPALLIALAVARGGA
jgi:hypothetical protein